MPDYTLSQIRCGCANCDGHPWANPFGWGECRPDGLWWCDWCLSCGCHNQGPSCSLERYTGWVMSLESTKER